MLNDNKRKGKLVAVYPVKSSGFVLNNMNQSFFPSSRTRIDSALTSPARYYKPVPMEKNQRTH